MLSVKNLHLSYGGISALNGVSLDLAQGEIVTVVGSNGAGKTSLMKAILGLEPLVSGDVVFQGVSLEGKSTNQRVAHGIALVPEGRELFGQLSILENLYVGAATLRDHKQLNRNFSFVFDLFPVLARKRNDQARSMSGGEQQMLACARALMSSPRCLLLDEPTIGLAPMIEDELMDAVHQVVKETGAGVLLVEQNAMLALENTTRAYVLELGKVAKSGLSEDLMTDPAIAKAYLGT